MLWNRERRQNDQWENSFNYASMKWCGSKPEWSSESDSKLVCSFSKGKKKKRHNCPKKNSFGRCATEWTVLHLFHPWLFSFFCFNWPPNNHSSTRWFIILTSPAQQTWTAWKDFRTGGFIRLQGDITVDLWLLFDVTAVSQISPARYAKRTQLTPEQARFLSPNIVV